MANNYVSFRPQSVLLPTYLRFSMSNAAFEKMSPDISVVRKMLQALSNRNTLLITKRRSRNPQAVSDDRYQVHTAMGIYECVAVDDNRALLIIGYRENTLDDQNYAMKDGVCFRTSQGIVVQVKSQKYNVFYDICNGAVLDNNAYEATEMSGSVAVIRREVARFDVVSQEIEETVATEDYQPEKKLMNLLQLSENYSILASELEKKHADMLGKIPYTSISALEFDRIDRVAYSFGVSGLDENTFKAGVQVEIEDRQEKTHVAEIIELVKKDSDSPATAMVLLFHEHIDISEFQQSGWFTLSFSPVNKEVQLAANEKIRNGEAAAKYMDTVFGRNQSRGFEHKDLSQVKAKLMQKKYPPNESQMKAIEAGINSRDVFLVMGPPGTGKTTVILEWVKYFVTQEHKRVLVSSQNNKAVDNVLARIADEKDIDIIRIGSEAKLQSEVVPYMFENKVKVLRRHIVENADEKMQLLSQIVAPWKEYQQSMDELARAELEQKQANQAFDKVAGGIFRMKYDKLSALYETYVEQRDRKKRLAAKIQTLQAKIDRYEHRGIFLRILLYFSNRRDQRDIRQDISFYDAAVNREAKAIREYNALRLEYQEIYDQLRTVEFAAVHRCMQNRAAILNRLQQKPEKEPGNIWGLFDNICSHPVRTVVDCDAVRGLLVKEMVRAEALREVMGDWKTEVDSRQNYALNEIVLESVDLVGATCIGINSQKRFANLDFDVTIIDEAGQIQVHNALVPMSVSNHLIMLGDHKQIPPTADEELLDLCRENGVATELLEKSLFEKMYYDLPEANKIMLDTQYRMPGEIADTISEWFYQGEYFSPDFKRGLKSLIPQLSDRPYVIIDTSREKNRYEKKIEGAGSSNELEARIVADLIRFLAADPETDLKEIGVISAYKSQVKLIKNKIARFLPKELVAEMAATLDSYQGQERDIILYSFTKSAATAPNRRRIGFLNELRRLNVAMTRCKKMLVLIGDMSFLGGCEHCDRTEDGEPIYEKSEKQFSDFINKMVADVQSGRGEQISYTEFRKRIGGGEK